MNIYDRINELRSNLYTTVLMSPEKRAEFQKEANMLSTILDWLSVQINAISEGSYDSETKQMSFKMKNTTPYYFTEVKFPLIISEAKQIPIIITDWRKGQIKDIVLYYDFASNDNYKQTKSVKLTTDIKDIEVKLHNTNANKANGGEEDKPCRIVKNFSEQQGYIVFLNSFCKKIPDYDIKAKARMLEKCLVSIFDTVQSNSDFSQKINKLMSIYLPTIRRIMFSYEQASVSNAQGKDIDTLRNNLNETLEVSINAIKTLNEKLYSDNAVESTVDLEVMRKFMEEDGLVNKN